MTVAVRGTIFDIQHYALYDGPGIRTIVFLKGCPLRCRWCHNPESWRLQPEVSYLRERCTGCGQCAEACPAGAVKVTDGVIRRDLELCRTCGECAKACPSGATEIIGQRVSVEDVLDEVVLDMPFYNNSGGGVTFSGGEPTMQPQFLMSLLDAARDAGVHTAIETCGYFDTAITADLAAKTDTFLFDIKHVDPLKHRSFTGVRTELILENFKAILGQAGDGAIVPRIPLIPGFNSDPGSIDDIACLLKNAGYGGTVHLMPYNGLARTKYEKVGRGDCFTDMGELREDDLEAAADTIARHSLDVLCNE